MVGKESSPTIRAEVPIETMAGVGRIVERFRVSLGQREVVLGDTKPGSHRAAGGSLAVLAIAVGNEGRIGIELEFDRAAGALGSVFLWHLSAPLWRCCRRTLRGDRYLGYRDVLLDGSIMTIEYVLQRRRAPKGSPCSRAVAEMVRQRFFNCLGGRHLNADSTGSCSERPLFGSLEIRFGSWI